MFEIVFRLHLRDWANQKTKELSLALKSKSKF